MPAIAHQNKILGNTSGGGSTILVTTSESTLYGQTVTLSDGTTTLSGTFSNTGECEFTGVMMTGNLTLVCSGVSQSISVPYFGNYSFVFSLFSATVNVTYPYSEGASCTLSDGTTTLIATGSPMAFNVPNAGTWTASVTLDGVSKTDTATITTDGQIASIIISFGTINVTYDNDFRGLSITCVQGGTTITKTAPSAGNAMTFFPPTTGQWTISGTVGGVPYPTTANVTSLSTPVSVNLETIPDGSTATPTDDIQKWLACAGIKDKAYTTLSQVLADSETFNALLGDSNACAYMARSTTWVGDSNGKVPTMTSNTTPSGVVTSSTSGNNDYKTFASSDNLLAQVAGWYVSGGTYNNSYIQYEFPQAVTLSRVDFAFPTTNNRSIDHVIKIQGSNNGSDWEDLANSSPTSSSIVYSIPFTKTASYKYVRFVVVSGTGSGATDNGYHIQYYCDGITTNQYAMNLLGRYDVACDALLSDATWAQAIVDSAYADNVFNIFVPKMTSNTAPSGECFTQTDGSAYNSAYQCFDGNTSIGIYNNGTYNATGYKFTEPVLIKAYSLRRGENLNTWFATYKLQASNNGSTWVDLTDTITVTSSTQPLIINGILPDNETPYQYYRYYLTGRGSASYISGVRYQFYGRKSSGEKIHGATGDTYYYISGGQHVPVTDPSLLDVGTYTIYSNGIAKDPDNLSNDYGKTVRICPNTKEIVIMPDGALYWYGWNPNWYNGNVSMTFTNNTNSQTIKGNTTDDYTWRYMDVTSFSKATTIVSANEQTSYALIFLNNTQPTNQTTWDNLTVKNQYGASAISTRTKVELNISSYSGDKYVGFGIYYAKSTTIDALWLE